MNQRIEHWSAFETLIRSDIPKAIALDLRGTLIDPPRRNHLSRCLNEVRSSEAWPSDVDTEIPKAVLAKYLTDASVYDWTLLTALELAEYVKERGANITTADAVFAYQVLQREYVSQSKLLVSDSALELFLLVCKQYDIKTVICADGFANVETPVVNACFPRAGLLLDGVFGSDSLGSNKLSETYFLTLATRLFCFPSEIIVIGDRIDKDIGSAKKAGCRTVLISADQPAEGAWATSLAEILPQGYDCAPHGAVFGRFQPFHREHLRLVLAAVARSEKLTIAITQPFPGLLQEAGSERTAITSNPIPYWLRAKTIQLSLAACKVPPDRVSIIPCPLDAKYLRRLFPPDTVAYTTVFDEWGDKKEALLRAGGLRVDRLQLGWKSITGTEIRRRASLYDDTWKDLVPAVVAGTLGAEIESFITNPYVTREPVA